MGCAKSLHPGWGLRLTRSSLGLSPEGVSEDLSGSCSSCWLCVPQMLIYMFYALPFYGLAAYALIFPGCSWLPDWALVFAGAIGQVRSGGHRCIRK